MRRMWALRRVPQGFTPNTPESGLVIQCELPRGWDMGCRLEEPRWQEEARARLWPWVLMEKQTWSASGLLGRKMGRGFWALRMHPPHLRKAGILHPRHLVSGEYLFRGGVPTF